MSRVYLFLFCSFLINTEALAVGREMKTDVKPNVCVSAAIADNPERDLFNSQPEDMLIQIVDENIISLAEEKGMLALTAFIRELVHLKSLMDYLANQIEKGETIPYSDYGIIPKYKGNFATFIFQNILHLYWLPLFLHNEINNENTRRIVDIYRQRIIFLLADKNRGVDVDAQYENGMSFLGFAAAYGYDDIVELLIRRGADFSYQVESGRFQGQTALQITKEFLNRYENKRSPFDAEPGDPEHIRTEKIEKYNRIIAFLEEAETA